MRYLILSLVLVSRLEAQTGRWVLVGTTADTTYYLDSAIVAKSDDDIIEVWTRSEFTRTVLEHKSNSYSHRISRYRINCEKGSWRSSQTTYYRGATLVRRTSSSARPMFYRPRWPTEVDLLQLACEMAAETRKPLVSLPVAAAEPQSPAAQVTERRIAPASVNARITQWTANHFVWLPPAADGAQIMLLLAGSNGRPANFRLIGSVAARQGYRTIGLMYPDDLAVLAACVRDRDRGCMARMRAEIIEGVEQSPHVNVDRDNSIDGRLVDLLRYLGRVYPSEGWEGFLGADGSPRWDRIAVGGLSQGGGHAAYIAKLRSVPRVVMFGAPADGIRGDVAPWMQIGATPAERYYGFRHARDQFRSIPVNWNALGLDKFGGVKNVDASTTSFGSAHLLTTDLLPATGSYEQAHASVFGDGPTPRRSDGTPVFDAAWRHLLGTP